MDNIENQITPAQFVHLRQYSGYSFDRGTYEIKDLVKESVEKGYTTICLTDYLITSGHLELYNLAYSSKSKYYGKFKPIFGVDINIECDITTESNDKHRILLIAKDKAGYNRLNALISKAYVENYQSDTPYLKQSWLLENPECCDGLIMLSGDFKTGEIANLIQSSLESKEDYAQKVFFENQVQKTIEFYQSIFESDFYLEIQRIGLSEYEDDIIIEMMKLSQYYNIPLVATNGVQMLNRNDFLINEMRGCCFYERTILDINRQPFASPEQYLKSEEEMRNTFKGLDFALDNTLKIAEQCNVKIELGKSFLPDFPIPEGFTEKEYFENLCQSGLEKRLIKRFPNEVERERNRPQYQERLNYEIECIQKMGFMGYFLIVQDFINWAKKEEIAIGCGRGSGAGSLVAYSLNIVDINPLDYGLLFERFLNPGRISMPDFDIDVDSKGRDRLIDYMKHKYGEKNTTQIASVGYMKAKAALGKIRVACQLNQQALQAISKLIIKEDENKSLKELYQTSEYFQDILKNNPQIEKYVKLFATDMLPTGHGTHAGGIVIAPENKGGMNSFSALSNAKHGQQSQFDKVYIEEIGLVKFDLLGLSTLTLQTDVLRAIEQRTGIRVDLANIDLADPKILDLFKYGNTNCVFQFESAGMQRNVLIPMQPNNFLEIVAANALFRPGPIETSLPPYLRRKNGEEPVTYPDEKLKNILSETYGVFIYQEQIMQIAQAYCGYSLSDADSLRKAIGKKDAEIMAENRDKFIQGAINQGNNGDVAKALFDDIEKFAAYCFNKSHAVAYANIAMQSAYLKTYYTGDFLSCYYNSLWDKDVKNSNVDKSREDRMKVLNEFKKFNIPLISPDINLSKADTYFNGKEAVYGLACISSVSKAKILDLEKEREENGKFVNFVDFLIRVPKLNMRELSNLISVGAFDSLNPNRKELLTNISDLANIRKALKKFEVQSSGYFSKSPYLRPYIKQTKSKVITYKNEIGEEVVLDSSNREELNKYITNHVIRWKTEAMPTLEELSEYEFKALGFNMQYQIIDSYLEKLGNPTWLGSLGDVKNIDLDYLQQKTEQSIDRISITVSAISLGYEDKGNSIMVKLSGDENRADLISPYQDLFKPEIISSEDMIVNQEENEEAESNILINDNSFERVRTNIFIPKRQWETFSDDYKACFEKDKFLIINGDVHRAKTQEQQDQYGNSFRFKDAFSFEEAKQLQMIEVHIALLHSEIKQVEKLLTQDINRGKIPVTLYIFDKSKTTLYKRKLSKDFYINDNPDLLRSLENIVGANGVQLSFAQNSNLINRQVLNQRQRANERAYQQKTGLSY